MNPKLRCLQIKVEPDLFYRACDELGLMVIQDMPSLVADGSRPPNPAQQAEFQRQLEVLIHEHKNYPSIVTWVRFFSVVKSSPLQVSFMQADMKICRSSITKDGGSSRVLRIPRRPS